MTISDRQDVREAFAALVATISDFEEVHDHAVEDLDGKTPVATILSAGVDRPPLTPEGVSTMFYLVLHHWVIYSSSADGWTEADAEDKLDDLERQVSQLISDNRQTANWNFLAQDGRSLVDLLPVGGVPYLHEVFPIRVEVYG